MSELFSVAILSETGSPFLVPPGLDVRPATWTAVERGGMWDAEVAVLGPLTELAGLTAWLGNRIEIRNANGLPVWWGDIATVEITAGGVRRGISLDGMVNRVQGDPASQLHERHDANDFDLRTQDKVVA